VDGLCRFALGWRACARQSRAHTVPMQQQQLQGAHTTAHACPLLWPHTRCTCEPAEGAPAEVQEGVHLRAHRVALLHAVDKRRLAGLQGGGDAGGSRACIMRMAGDVCMVMRCECRTADPCPAPAPPPPKHTHTHTHTHSCRHTHTHTHKAPPGRRRPARPPPGAAAPAARRWPGWHGWPDISAHGCARDMRDAHTKC
jgi:hypothetical protein